MGYFFFALILLGSALELCAQKPEKMFIRRSHEEGTMYFIRPQKMGISPKAKGEADFTLDRRDTVAKSHFTITWTMLSREPLRNLDSAVLLISDQRVARSAQWERYYVDPKGKNWTNRYALRFEPSEGLRWMLAEEPIGWVIYSGGKAWRFSPGSKEQFIIRTLAQVMAIETDLDEQP